MFYAGIDAHMKSSSIYILDGQGRKVSSSKVMTGGRFCIWAGTLGSSWIKSCRRSERNHTVGLPTTEGSESESNRGEPEPRTADRRIHKEKLIVWTPKPWRSCCDWGDCPKYISHPWKRAVCARSWRASTAGAPANGDDQPSPRLTSRMGRHASSAFLSGPRRVERFGS